MPSIGLSRNITSFQLFLIRLTTILACFISMILTVRLACELRDADGSLIPIAIGVAWELGKYWLATVGLNLIQHPVSMVQRFIGGLLLVLVAVIIIGSICASVGAMANSADKLQARSLVDSRRYQALKKEVEDYDKQIEILSKSAQSYNAFKDPQSAVYTSTMTEDVMGKKNAAEAKLVALEKNSGVDVGSSFADQLIILFGGGDAPLKTRIVLIANIVIAIVIDALSIFGLALWHLRIGSDASSGDASVHRINFDANKKRRQQNNLEGRADTGVQDGINMRFQQAENMLLNGQLAPTYREVQEFLNAGVETTKRYFQAWVEKGVLRKSGRRYELVA